MRAGYEYIGVGTGAMVFDAAGHVFMAQRGAQAKNERGLWEFPGGTVEFGEQLHEAVQRELREEYAFDIAIERILSVFDHILAHEQQHWVSVMFIARHVAGLPRIVEPDKCMNIGWFPLAALPEPRSALSEKNLQMYLSAGRDDD